MNYRSNKHQDKKWKVDVMEGSRDDFGGRGPGALETLFMEAEKKRIAKYIGMLQQIFNVTNDKRPKRSLESQKLRQRANDIFSKNKHSHQEHLQVWELYSKSIALAPALSKELSSALYNRSALSYHLKKYPECLQDLNTAEKCDCSEMLRMKIAYKKAECLIKIRNLPTEAIVQTAITEMENISIEEGMKTKMIAKLENIRASPTIKANVPDEDRTMKIDKIDFQEKVPVASTAVTLKFNEKYGRHVVSTRYIKPGEILAVEKVYPVLNLSHLYTHCSECSRVAWASIPCEFCAFAVYCSEKCKNEAWHKYHDIECDIIDMMYADGNDIPECNPNYQVVLSTRLVLYALKTQNGSISELKDELMKIDTCTDRCNRGFSKNGILQSASPESFLSLLSNAHKEIYTSLEAISRLAALTVLGFAQFTKVFGRKFDTRSDSTIPKREDMLFIGALISRMSHALYTNQYQLGEARSIFPRLSCKDLRDTKHSEEVVIGSYIAPFCSLFNHACLQNAYHCVTDDGSMIIFSVSPIEKDTQIFTSYRGDLAHHLFPRISRQLTMSRLAFPQCECRACIEDWPVRDQLPNICELTTDKELLGLLAEITREMVDITVGIETFTEMVMKCIEKVVKKSLYPSKEFDLLMNHSTRLNIILYGKFFRIPPGC
ncbi:hypothetical protein QAD02_008712 [Eretmocerus hayati]|uniref:Uncharacterized protein n=1 Tax=Eretmocerus hayati TaxID=131215 RepID=A0ACC2NBQ3_9HYME|nr:hypothetical protein QAD02_008712 [Eretmocerus hayati]